MDIAKIRKKLKKPGTAADEHKTSEPACPEVLPIEHKESALNAETASDLSDKSETGETTKALETKSTVIPACPAGSDIKAETEDMQDEAEILAFKIANEEYAVRITDLQEVLRLQRITFVPRAPKYLTGITSLRGKILPVIDLKDRLGLTEENAGKQKIIVISGKKEALGALVGTVLGVFRFPEGELLPPPSTLTDKEKNFIEGVVRMDNKFISILKVDEILNMEAL
ncbi:MAG: chemotaxis protein CheW [Nitrospirota bacterium]